MNNDVLRGKWMQVKGEVRGRWGKLTDDDMTGIQGETEKLIGKLQEQSIEGCCRLPLGTASRRVLFLLKAMWT